MAPTQPVLFYPTRLAPLAYLLNEEPAVGTRWWAPPLVESSASAPVFHCPVPYRGTRPLPCPELPGVYAGIEPGRSLEGITRYAVTAWVLPNDVVECGYLPHPINHVGLEATRICLLGRADIGAVG